MINTLNEEQYLKDIKQRFIKRIQESNGMQKDLAHVMGISPQRLSKMLHSDQNMTLKTLYKISDSLGLYPEIILREKEGNKQDRV